MTAEQEAVLASMADKMIELGITDPNYFFKPAMIANLEREIEERQAKLDADRSALNQEAQSEIEAMTDAIKALKNS